MIGFVSLVNLGLKVFVFTAADDYIAYPRVVAPETGKTDEQMREEEKRFQEQQIKQQRQNTSAQALAMILVGVPLYVYHWGLIKKEK